MKANLSICIPMYNCETYIVDCLKSIQRQFSDEGLEVIIIDDCSTDRSRENAENYIAENRMNAHIFSNTQNSGVACSRNVAVEKANGEYVMFLDSDDYLNADFYENVIEYIKSNQYDMLLFGYNEVDEKMQLKSSLVNQEEKTSGLRICGKLSHYNFKICIGSYLVRKQLLIDNAIKVSGKYKYGEDQELNYKCLLHSGKVKVLGKSFYNYRYNSNSAMNSSCDFRRFDTVESRKELLQYIKINFEQEKELIDRFQNFLIPEAIITITRVLVYAGTDRKRLKEYKKNQGYDELVKKVAEKGRLSKGLKMEWMLQMHAWGLYSMVCKIRKHRKE